MNGKIYEVGFEKIRMRSRSVFAKSEEEAKIKFLSKLSPKEQFFYKGQESRLNAVVIGKRR